jgi:transposase
MIQASSTDLVVGVDTHKRSHAAVAITGLGARVAEMTITADRDGYRRLEAWATALGAVRAFGVEGTGSYGAGLARALRAAGHVVHEVDRPDRRLRRRRGKTDPLDAEAAARAVLGGHATGLAKAGTGRVEMIRHLKVARDTAVKARTQALLALKALVVGAPAALREALEAIAGRTALVRHLAALRPGAMTSPTASAKASLRALARRWLDLDAEIKAHDAQLGTLVESCAPTLVTAYGIKAGTAAEMLVLVGDNPERIRSEGAFAKLCGACPIPASSGQTNRHRPDRGGNRQANAALHRVVVGRMRGHPPTIDYVRRRTAEGKPKREIIRCLKRFVAREIFAHLCRPTRLEPAGELGP